MKDQKRNIINLFFTSVVIVFFILLFSSSDKSAKKTDNTQQYVFQSGIHSDNIKAVIADDIQIPSIQKSSEYDPDQCFNKNQNLFSYRQKITKSFILSHNTQLSIKPGSICRFYYHLFSKDDDDWLILS